MKIENIDINKIKGYNNGILIEKVLPEKGRTTPGGIVIPDSADKPAHVFSKVLAVGWSCSRRIKKGDLIVAEKAMNTTLKNPETGRELQFVRENDVIGQVDAEDVRETMETKSMATVGTGPFRTPADG